MLTFKMERAHRFSKTKHIMCRIGTGVATSQLTIGMFPPVFSVVIKCLQLILSSNGSLQGTGNDSSKRKKIPDDFFRNEFLGVSMLIHNG